MQMDTYHSLSHPHYLHNHPLHHTATPDEYSARWDRWSMFLDRLGKLNMIFNILRITTFLKMLKKCRGIECLYHVAFGFCATFWSNRNIHTAVLFVTSVTTVVIMITDVPARNTFSITAVKLTAAAPLGWTQTNTLKRKLYHGTHLESHNQWHEA